MAIHNYQRQLERQIELVNEDSEISKKNKETISKFKDYLLSEGIGAAKIGRYMLDIRRLAKLLNKPFEKATKENLRAIVGEINQSKLAEESKKCVKVLIKRLYRYLEGVEEKGVYPDKVKWISTQIPLNHTKLPEELLTEKETENIIRCAGNVRDKALLSTVAESGARIGEIGNLKIKHVSFEEYGARLTISGKTGTRKLLVINSTPYLQEWINQHPLNDNAEEYLWYNPQGKTLTYSRISAILKNTVRKAGIKKRVYLHLFRHSQATRMASVMSEAGMKQYFGWHQSSRMATIYVHMSGRDVDKDILKFNGIEVKEKKFESKMKPINCVRCKVINEPTNRFCKVCGMILDKEEANKVLKEDGERQKADEIMNKLVSDPEILELIKKKLAS